MRWQPASRRIVCRKRPSISKDVCLPRYRASRRECAHCAQGVSLQACSNCRWVVSARPIKPLATVRESPRLYPWRSTGYSSIVRRMRHACRYNVADLPPRCSATRRSHPAVSLPQTCTYIFVAPHGSKILRGNVVASTSAESKAACCINRYI